MSVHPASEPCVYIVDDDQSVLRALSRLLSSAGYEVKAFHSPKDFLQEHDPDVSGCALLDVGMAELDGLAVQQALLHDESHRPVIFITGHDDANTGVRAVKAGAFDYLTKPVQDTALLAVVQAAIESDIESRRKYAELRQLRSLLSHVTPREIEIMRHVVRGRLNKQIAFDLGIVEKTVKVHRARVMEKLNVRSVAELVRVAQRLGITSGPA
jgi:FixJ family two-component response regulator